MEKRIKKTKIILLSTVLVTNIFAETFMGGVNSFVNNANSNMQSLYGVDINSAISQLDINNLDIASLTGSLSYECNFDYALEYDLANLINDQIDRINGMIPKIAVADICSGNIDLWNQKFNKTLNLGNCSASVSGQASSPLQNKIAELANVTCQQMNDKIRKTFNQQNLIQLQHVDSMPFRLSANLENVEMSFDGLGLQVDRKIKALPEMKYSNGMNFSTLYNNKDGGVLSHTKILTSSTTPSPLVQSYLYDDYDTYSAYERYAKTETAETDQNGKKTIPLSNLKPKVADSYTLYMVETNLKSVQIVSDFKTPYSMEQNLSKKAKEIKAELGAPQGSTSAELKKSYMKKKEELLKRLTTFAVSEMKANMENYLALQFMEDEDRIKRSSGYVVQPSAYKVQTRAPSEQLAYANKIFRQQTEEARRLAEFQIKQQIAIDNITLLAKKVALQSFEYNPIIAEKELEEILASSSGGSSGGSSSSIQSSVSSALGF